MLLYEHGVEQSALCEQMEQNCSSSQCSVHQGRDSVFPLLLFGYPSFEGLSLPLSETKGKHIDARCIIHQCSTPNVGVHTGSIISDKLHTPKSPVLIRPNRGQKNTLHRLSHNCSGRVSCIPAFPSKVFDMAMTQDTTLGKMDHRADPTWKFLSP